MSEITISSPITPITTGPEEMQRRRAAAEKLQQMMRKVYEGKPSSRAFVPKRISASSLVAKKAVKIAEELLEAHDAVERGHVFEMRGSYWGVHGDMASSYLFGQEHGLAVDGEEFWVTANLGDGWLVSCHPDGVKSIDDRVFICEQKNWAKNSDLKKKIVALRQAAFYLSLMAHRVRTTEADVHHGDPKHPLNKGWTFGQDPNYLRPTVPFVWWDYMQPGGVLRSVSGTPPGDVYTVAFSDEDLEAHRLQMIEKAMHIKAAVEQRDLDYARKWDSEHRDEFGEKLEADIENDAQLCALADEYLKLKEAEDEIGARREALRDVLKLAAEKNPGREWSAGGFIVKVQRTTSAGKWDKKAAEKLGVLEQIYTPGKEGERVLVTGPEEKA